MSEVIEKEKLTAEEKLEKRISKLNEKESALKQKKKDLEKKRRAKEKARLAKEKAEAEAEKALVNAKIAALARIWGGCKTDDILIEQFAKAILKNEPNLQERIDEILAGKIDPMGK